MNTIINFILKNENKILFITVIFIFLGVFGFYNLKFDAVPDITNVQVVVNTKTGGLDTEKIEQFITRPIEFSLSGIPHLQDMRSISKIGLSQVTLVFEDGTDIYWARSQVSERVNVVRNEFPEGITPELAPISTGLGEIYMYQPMLSEKKKSEFKTETEALYYLYEIQNLSIKPKLKRISGVAEIDTNGGFNRELHINLNPHALFKNGIGIDTIYKKLKSWGDISAGGYLIQDNQTFTVRGLFSENKIEDLKNWTIGYNYLGKKISLSDIAEIRFDPAIRVGAATQKGEEIVLGTVLMQTGANSKQVASEVDKALNNIKLPDGVSVKTLYSRSFLVDKVINTVFSNLMEGALLVILVLFLFLWNIKASVIVAATLPLTLVTTFFVMYSLGLSGNLMSLGALDFGLLVDSSIVFVETLMHTLSYGNKRNISEEIKNIFKTTTPSTTSGILLLIIVYLPVLFLSGIERKLFSPMATTVILALGISLLISYFFTTIICKKLLANETVKIPAWIDKLTLIYETSVRLVLKNNKIFIGVFICSMVISIIIISSLGRDFMPSLNEADIVLNVSRPTTISLKESIERQKKLEIELAKNSSFENIFSRLGTPESATDPMGVYLADTFVILKKDNIKNLTENKNNLIDKSINLIKSLEPDAEVSSTQPIEMRFNEMLEGSRADVSIRIFGEDLNQLYEYTEKIKSSLINLRGLVAVEKDPLTSLVKSQVITYKLNNISPQRFNLSIGEINEYFETFSLGKKVGDFFFEGRKIPIILHLDEVLKNKSENISSFPMSLDGGGIINMAELLSTDTKEHVTTVARAWGQRYSSLALEVRDIDIETFVKDADQKIKSTINLPKGIRLEWGGQFSNLNRAKKRFAILVPILLFVLLFIVYQTLGSIKNTFIIFSVLPFAIAGGGISLYLSSINLSVSAFIGFITLAGIALLNSLIFISHFQYISNLNYTNLYDSIISSAKNRLRPVLMTALVAGIGFLPMILNEGLGAEVQRPLALVVVGGIITSTIATLYFLPCLLLTFNLYKKN